MTGRPSSGSCFGFTMRWLEACILGEEQKFINRAQKIYVIRPDSIHNFLSEFEQVKDKVSGDDGPVDGGQLHEPPGRGPIDHLGWNA